MATCLALQDSGSRRRDEMRRNNRRSPAALPALVDLLGRSHRANLRNISEGGAMIESDARLFRGDEIDFRCGGIEVRAKVVWHSGSSFGLQFTAPVEERFVREQLLRADHLADRRNARRSRLRAV